jgi:hypothetical protein
VVKYFSTSVDNADGKESVDEVKEKIAKGRGEDTIKHQEVCQTSEKAMQNSRQCNVKG